MTNLNAEQVNVMCDVLLNGRGYEPDIPRTCENCEHFFACPDDTTRYGWCDKANYWREGTARLKCRDWGVA